MTEAAKTVTLVAVSLGILLLGIFTQPKPPASATQIKIEKLFSKLDDPLKPKRIKITTYDEASGEPREFEVAHINGAWVLTSHQNHPADAQQQMADAATALFGLKVSGESSVVSDNPNDHELYGVIEPDKAKNQVGQKGIGKLVEMEDNAKNSLARLIIGKEVKSNSGDEMGGKQAKLRYVRVKGQDRVYRVEMASDKFSTKLENWIETDLLKLNGWDITQVDLRDFTARLGVTADRRPKALVEQKANIDLAFNDQKFVLEKLEKFKDKKPTEEKLKEGEELNSVKLDEMKSALDNLKIVDVQRKPEQMSADIKAGSDFSPDQESFVSLANRGFIIDLEKDKINIVPANGEAVVGMKDGVEYVLKFGEIAGIENGSDKDDEAGDVKTADGKATEKGDKDKDAAAKEKADTDTLRATENKSASVNRYVMVTARFNPNLLTKPELEALPEIKKAPEKKDDVAKGAAKPDAKADAAKKGGDAKPKEEEAKKAEEPNPEDDIEAQEDRRDKIEKENKRKQAEYDEKVKKGEERAKELNARFADWYYVISDATYRKIHLGADDIIMKKPKEEKEDKAGPVTVPDPFSNRGTKGAGKATPAPAGKK